MNNRKGKRMKSTKKKLSLLLVMALMASIVSIQPMKIQAATKPSLTAENYALTLVKSDNYYDNACYIPIQNFPKNGKITKVTSSNPKVVKASVAEYSNSTIELYVKKTGKATVKVKIKAGKKTYNLKCSVVVRNYVSPISSLKIGNKQYKSSVSKLDYFSIKYKKNSKYKISVKCKKNWQLTHIGFFEGSKYKTIKNNGKITVKKVNSYLVLSFYNSKTKALEDIRVNFSAE